ncbi:GGDEF domain-containing protein [Parahaliea aestuarii]|uniref:diguanylate cyclase n=1 Tax=Parahaliea aestuarii TaxID=1852021 RepID=A0A5C9A1B5_9GAMM|nr:GGDEF domain-containing protein [Parahaliea aestuarii]TXS94643.1 GGDEF domain-containing protein [Parahaliea aestuarii]
MDCACTGDIITGLDCVKIWRRNHPQITVDDPRYRQVSLLYSILLIMMIYCSVIGTLNVVLFKDMQTALFDYAGFFSAVAIYVYVSRTAQFRRASWAALLALIAVLASFTFVARGATYSLIWVTVLPPIAFFLLGLRAGTWLSATFTAAVLLFLLAITDKWESGPFSIAALLNFAEVMTVHLLIFRHYERSRLEAFEQLRLGASIDRLTGLFNRERLDELLADTLAQARRGGQNTALIMLDVDHFKAVNDRYGHLHGDVVLQRLAHQLRENVRQTDRVGRWGGEEFLVICPDTDARGAGIVAEKVRQAIAAGKIDSMPMPTVSLGVAAGSGEVAASSLLQAADRQLYRAKREGRNRVCIERQAPESETKVRA